MTTLFGILSVAAVAHLGGQLTGGVLARFGVLGFGKKLRIARSALKVGKALRTVFDRTPSAKARDDLKQWLQDNDPQNESGLGAGVV